MDTPTQLSFLTTSAARVTIREPPATEQPRERLRCYGPAALSSAELPAIALGLTDLGQAETLLVRYEGLDGLVKAPLAELAGRYGGPPAASVPAKPPTQGRVRAGPALP